MKLERATCAKIALIVLLCVGVCGFFGGCGRGAIPWGGSLLAPGGLLGCAGWNMTGEIVGCAGDAAGEIVGYAGEAASEIANASLCDSSRSGNVPMTSDGAHFEIGANAIDRIDLAWLAGDARVTVVPDSETGGKILVDEAVEGGTAPAMICSNENDTLSIAYMEGGQGLSGCTAGHFGRKSLTVQLPASIVEHLKSFELVAASGHYELTDLTCDLLEMEVASGDVGVTGLATQKAALSLASGRVSIEGLVEDAMEIDQASGATTLAFGAQAPREVRGSLSSGSIDLALPVGTLLDLDVDKTSGNFNNQMGVMADDKSGEAIVCAIDFDMLSGTFNVAPAQ